MYMNCNGCDRLVYGCEHKTHRDGTFYQMPRDFPCVLHDWRGCLCLTQNQYSELVRMNIIRESTGGAVGKINIRNGISKIYGYKICTRRDSCPKYRARKNKHNHI